MFSHAFMRSTVRQRNFWLYRSFHFLSTLQLLSCKVCLMEGSQTRHSRTGGVNPLVRQFEFGTLARPSKATCDRSGWITSEWPVIGSEPQQFRQADFNDASRKPLPRPVPVAF